MRGLLLVFLWAAAGLFPVLALTEDRAWARRMLIVALVAACVMIAYGAAFRWFMRRMPRAAPRAGGPPRARIAGPFMFALVLVLLAMEGVVVARALGERGQAEWLPVLREFQDSLTAALAPAIPALRELPPALAAAGYEARIGEVTGAYAVSYAGAILLGLLILCGFAWMWARRPANWALNWTKLDQVGLFRLTIGTIAVSISLPLLAYATVQSPRVSVERIFNPNFRRRPKWEWEWLWKFETDSIHLAYRSIFGVTFFLLITVVMLFSVSFIIARAFARPSETDETRDQDASPERP